jgi:murein L,D-transpeptidase YafK
MLNRSIIIISLLSGLALGAHSAGFKDQQLVNVRVKAAFIQKEPVLKQLFAGKKLAYPPKAIFIRIFKREQRLEVWARADTGPAYVHVKDYPVCASSGELGPKRRMGDCQVPEGFYRINHFNPFSNFHLSLGVDYPNASDRYFSRGRNPGGSIYLHGNCVTIGCVPIGDEGIKELYPLAVEARDNGQEKIQVHIFPAVLDSAGFSALRAEFGTNSALLDFWTNLKQGYDQFERDHLIPKLSVSARGKYLFSR